MTQSRSLQRFIEAQEGHYQHALAEIRNGRKQSHWMWFVFPQLVGLGSSSMAQRYAIQDMQEAIAYLSHPVLGKRLIEISGALLQLNTNDPYKVFGSPDDMKLKSSMTLFSMVPNASPVFKEVLNQFYQGETDKRTVKILNS